MTSPQGPGAEVVLDGLSRHYGSVHALDGLHLTIEPGEMVALLGPSGCGKTTALRILAGLERADEGRVLVSGQDISDVPANKRDMGMVFQAYSLFPHMTVLENVGFGLRMRGVGQRERRARGLEVLQLVGLGDQRDRYAHQLSGGQQQRVALARALAVEPSVLLLDEPLSALDAKVRTQLREEIRRVQMEVGRTTVFVTHDQEEALAIADRVGVMSNGRLEQIAPPEELYARPRTRFVAEFVGLTNRLDAAVDGSTARVLDCTVPLLDGSVAERPGPGAGAAGGAGGAPRAGRERRGGVEVLPRLGLPRHLRPRRRAGGHGADLERTRGRARAGDPGPGLGRPLAGARRPSGVARARSTGRQDQRDDTGADSEGTGGSVERRDQ